MNKILLTAIAAASILSVTGCQRTLDDIKPNGSQLSIDQIKNASRVSADRANSGVAGLYAQLTARGGIFGIDTQSDFGYPSLAARLDHAGDNMVSTTHGYNWFRFDLHMQEFQTKTSGVSVWSWTATYENIKLANDILRALSDSADDPRVQPIVGEVKAMRAWDYFLLAQLFGKTYFGNENTLAVPIITENTTDEEQANNPRVTVQKIYEFILQDLDDATKLLKGVSHDAKNKISESVAYGIRSRVHLVMHNWSAAEADAKKAIELFNGRPFTIEEASIPNFDDVQTGVDTMWGIIITKDDGVTKSGIANFTSMMTSLCFGSAAYTTSVGTYKKINTRLWSEIPESDVRRGWWAFNRVKLGVNEKGEDVFGFTSPLVHRAYPKLEGDIAAALHPFSVVKFAPNDKDPMSPINAVDFQLMRIEEMYYNLAEAQAMGGKVQEGLTTLVDFVKKYRNPEYAFTASTAEAIQDEIYFQKRIEFWGEGLSWFDMLRMKKGINRVDVATKDDGGYPELCRWNIPDGSPTFTFQIPLKEEQNNKAIEGNNNPAYTPPTDLF